MSTKLYEMDWRNILDTVYRINSAATLEELQLLTLKHMSYTTPFHQGIFHIYQHHSDKYTLYDTPFVYGVEAKYLDEFSEKYARDEFFARIASMSRNEAFRDTDVYPDELRVQTEWFKEIYEPQGIHYALRCILTNNGALSGSVDLFKTKEQGDFSDRDVLMMSHLSPHIALKLEQLLSKERPQSSLTGSCQRLMSRYALTQREAEVVSQMRLGLTNEEIAKRLYISTSTLKKHVHGAYRKIGVCSRAQLYSRLDLAELD